MRPAGVTPASTASHTAWAEEPWRDPVDSALHRLRVLLPGILALGVLGVGFGGSLLARGAPIEDDYDPAALQGVLVAAASTPGQEQPVADEPRGVVTRPAGEAPGASGERVDPAWLERTASRTGIAPRVLRAYAQADLTLGAEQPGCALGWNTIAGIGYIETRHGTYRGARVGADGRATPQILGIALNGNGVAAISDTDGGRLDGDTRWDRAVGPMQFIPSTWARHGADGNGDGVADPHNIDDAALAAGRYLCAASDLRGASAWRSGIWAYNRSDSHINQVAAAANWYAQRGQ